MSTMVVNTHEAKSRLSELIRAAESGTTVIVARNGRPVARIVAWPDEHARRRPGAFKGAITIHGDIVSSDPEIVTTFDESATSLTT